MGDHLFIGPHGRAVGKVRCQMPAQKETLGFKNGNGCVIGHVERPFSKVLLAELSLGEPATVTMVIGGELPADRPWPRKASLEITCGQDSLRRAPKPV